MVLLLLFFFYELLYKSKFYISILISSSDSLTLDYSERKYYLNVFLKNLESQLHHMINTSVFLMETLWNKCNKLSQCLSRTPEHGIDGPVGSGPACTFCSVLCVSLSPLVHQAPVHWPPDCSLNSACSSTGMPFPELPLLMAPNSKVRGFLQPLFYLRWAFLLCHPITLSDLFHILTLSLQVSYSISHWLSPLIRISAS